MPKRTGLADLPLHGGRAPRWLFDRMAQLAPAVVEAIVLEHGPAEVLRRLSDPFWFQAFGAVLGFDWHSSGVTTVVCGALKTGLAGREADTGIWVAGGKGRASRKTPLELVSHGQSLGLDGERLAYTSRLTAKVDTAAVQDGFQIYHHTFFHTTSGEWAVVQQGMRDGDAAARRYHWLGEVVRDFVDEPHAAIASDARANGGLNLVAHESANARRVIVDLAKESPDSVVREAKRIVEKLGSEAMPSPASGDQLNFFGALDGRAGEAHAAASPAIRISIDEPTTLYMPRPHAVDVRRDVDPARLHKVLLSTYEAQPQDFEALLGVEGLGPKSLRALALLAEVVHGQPASVRDPARFSFAHGGKDGHPYPVDRPTYDRTVEWLREAVSRARMGHSDRMRALKRLSEWSGA